MAHVKFMAVLILISFSGLVACAGFLAGYFIGVARGKRMADQRGFSVDQVKVASKTENSN
jgi:hypothetical protein